MKIKKEYSFTHGRPIWRLIPYGTNLLIEERDLERKEAFFNSIDAATGKKLFTNYQLTEKFWTGVEAVHNNIIFFHGFLKPDMPIHSGITAVDADSREVLWENPGLNYLFILDNKLYAYVQQFDSRKFYTLDYKTGSIHEELNIQPAEINILRDKALSNEDYSAYLFPVSFNVGNNSRINDILGRIKTDYTAAGPVEYVIYKNILLFNFHEVQKDGTLNNLFRAVDLDSDKVIFKFILNQNSKLLVPDAFFVKDNLLFLLKDKTELTVCSFI